MKKSLKLIFASLLLLETTAHSQSNAIITFFFRKYPYFKKQTTNNIDFVDKYSKKLQQPHYLFKKITGQHRSYRFGVPGIMCLYAGNIALSDAIGQITFPRLQQKSDINILITKSIIPAYIVAPATINNWRLDPAHESKMYSVKLKQDHDFDLYYFETTPIDLPKNQTIPLDTIIIISDPNDVYIAQGATMTDYGANLTLPDIFIKRTFCFVYNSMYNLAIKQYFEQNKSDFQLEGQTVSAIVQPAVG